jgi:serine/threonine-protein kinase
MADARLASALAGRYRIERDLGAGGIATVYLDHDEEHLRSLESARPQEKSAE